MPPLTIQLVVFDWAGTTIDFGCLAPAGAFVAAFAARGVAVTMAEARGPMGLHKKDHIRAMLCTESVGAKWRASVGREWTEADVEELYRYVTPRQLAAVEQHSDLIPGVLDVAKELRARGVKIAGTTGYFRAAADAALAAAKRQGYSPDFNICADEVPAGRPAPWMIFRCMEALGAYPPAAVVKVGDTVIDIEDARNAGCWSAGVVDSSNEMGLTSAELIALPPTVLEARRQSIQERYRNAGAHAVLRDVRAVPSLLDSLNARLAQGESPEQTFNTCVTFV
jgi:phosphonoacetaldehyde hydrolase